MELVIDNVSLATLGFSVAERPDIPSPEMEVETIDVDGRDGAYTVEKGYQDITFTVKLNALEEGDMRPVFRQLKAKLLNAKTVHLSDDDVYYKVKQVRVGNIQNEVDCYGVLEPQFTCDPFQYQRNVPMISLSAAGEVANTGTCFAKPLMRVYGRNGTVTWGSRSFELKGIQSSVPYVVVDSETENAYYGSTNLNRFMTGPFPTFEEGRTAVSFTGDITKIEIEPRWRYL